MRLNSGWFALLVALLLAHGNPAGAQQTTPRQLTLKEAIGLALKANLSVRVASAYVDETAGTRERRRSALLPHAFADTQVLRENVSLGAMGVSIPGIPSVVGPFNRYDFRVSGSQSLIDRQAYHNWKASEKQEQAGKLDYQDARDLVIRQTAGFYLDSQTAAAEVEAAESRVTTSDVLEKLARDQHDHGLATAVDVVRAQVQLARDRQNLLVARNTYQTSLLTLARFLGLSPGAPLELAERLQFRHFDVPDVDQVLHSALDARPDYRALVTQRESLIEQQKASRARYLPTLTVSGDYGALGRTFGSLAGIGDVQATLSVNLFDRDRTGEQKEIASRVKRLDEQIDDLGRGIEEDLRKAVLDLQSTANQVDVTEAALDLAQRELTLVQDRFRNGVSDNVEVVSAQTTLAGAQDDRIMALARHADAGMALARALGSTETNYLTYLGRP